MQQAYKEKLIIKPKADKTYTYKKSRRVPKKGYQTGTTIQNQSSTTGNMD